MTRKLHRKEKKELSARGMLKQAGKVFSRTQLLPRSTRGKVRQISRHDCLMSALAMFSLKSPSLLAFDSQRVEEPVRHNLKSLYGVQQVPSDTYMRQDLDQIDPRELREAFLAVFRQVQGNKLLDDYRFLNDTYLVSVDGSQVFSSNQVHCESCCQKVHKTPDGDKITYHHQILAGVVVHPQHRQVIPLCPEPITKQDGCTKNDCEQNAFHRFLDDFKREHPRLKTTIISDALSANAPHINHLRSLSLDFIVNVKPKGNKGLFSWLKGVELREVVVKVGANEYTLRYINGIPLNETAEAPQVNYYECDAKEIKGRKESKKHFSWVTSHKINDKNVYQLMRGARARWRIENETFNTLKNQGYQLEHNFGHGKKNLHTVFVSLMMLAFLIDQVQEASCGLFRAALARAKTRRWLWEKMRSFFHLFLVDCWSDLYQTIGSKFKGVSLIPDTS